MSLTERFTRAQDAAHGGLDNALAELAAGRKQGHWIWYVFPQLRGLGSSSTAHAFGIEGREEAEAYLCDEVLRGRLLRSIVTVKAQVSPPRSIHLATLMGSHLDALKLVSSLTLFEAVASDLQQRDPHCDCGEVAAQARAVLDLAATQGFPRCRFTRERLDP
jgi:uncharacterized protein (DUF1810 family)